MLGRYSSRIRPIAVSKIDLKHVSVGFLPTSNRAQGDGWRLLHDHIGSALRSITDEQWQENLREYDHTTQLLVDKLASSGCTLDSSTFRKPLIQQMLNILSGEDVPDAPNGTFDVLVSAIDQRYHADIWRTLREEVSGVSPQTLEDAVRLFPTSVSKIITDGDRITATEKDNVLRHVLSPALEGRNKRVLDIFVQLGNRRITDFKKSSNRSTVELLDGNLDAFSKAAEDRVWARQVVEVIQGKRRARSFLDIVWGINKDED